ncbi:MAG: class I SAM-dependent RNA methyltransferase [Pseudomonadota bacterium]
MTDDLDIFLAGIPGLEAELAAEARELGFAPATAVAGGVELRGSWQDVWRANLWLRGASRVLVRVGAFAAPSLRELETAARAFRWLDVLAPREPVRLDVTCRKSRVAHAGAAAQKVERALRSSQIFVSPDAAVTLKLRIERDTCTVSIDSSGAPLHKRGHKVAVGKAPLRETMAALLLRRCGYTAGEALIDPFCGSGTLPIEAAEITAGLAPGRARSFAFERLPSFNAALWAQTQSEDRRAAGQGAVIQGSDRDAGAVANARQNAERAGVDCLFEEKAVSDLTRPKGEPGLVICNPPYGARIGNPRALMAPYAALGERLRRDFSGWRVAILTSERPLAHATGLQFEKTGAPIAHGGLKVWLFRTKPL